MVGPYTIYSPNRIYRLQTLTILDPLKRWLEVVEIPKRDSQTVALAFDRAWLSRYLRPRQVLHDKGTELTGNKFQEILTSYNLKINNISTKNPQAN